ncbi:uncharacterized protein KY384_007940 [Bacidia gigantensis]|uniref:uncharacterized protein n=1 Tax=Bacidia gigantensis TaxID=2732470 RepID=UPI001D048293|nr:uncharacterized protein KY384_007940 [Bacidia gigantensis]KAG8527786.1 hypothetical protein KY384_007940 [Bacidia gigantensis]
MPPMISDTPKCRTFRHQLPIHPVSSPGPSRVRDLPRGKERDWLKKDVTSKYSRRYLSGQQSPTPTPAPRRQLSSPFAFRDIERQREDTSSFETAHEKPEARDDVNNHLRNTRKSRKADREDTHPPKTRKRRAGFEKEAAEESEREADLSKRSVLSSSQEKQHRKRQEPERAAKGKRKWRGERQKAAEAKNDIARKIAELIGEDDTKSKDEARSTPRRKDKRLRNIDPALLPSKANPPLLEEMHYEYQVPTKIATEEYPHAIPMNPPEPIGISSRATNSESHPPEQEVQKEEKQTEPEIAPQEKPNNKRKKSKANSGARRLTFTPNGGPKLRSSHRSSDARPNRSGSGPESPVQSVDAPELAQTLIKNDTRSNKTSAKTSRSSQKMLSNGDQSKESTTVLPEAQVQDLPPARVPLVSTSTNLLETDEQPTCVESVEEDSYVNLATQAAVNKAMQRFNDVVADMDTPSPNKARRSAVSDRLRNEELSTKKTPAVEPISTQAMLDQMSPFTITTIKKRSPMLRDRTASQISPSKPAAAHFANSQAGQTTLPTYSPNMSTSPSPTPTPSLSQAHPSTSPSKSPPRSPPKSQKGKQKAPPTPSTKRRKTALDSSPPPAPPPFLSRQKSSVQSHAHPERTPKSTLSELTSFSINPDGTLTERGLMDGQYPEGQILGAHGDGEGETYGTLPSLDFSKPFAGIASGGVRAGGVLGNGVTPTSTAPSVVVDEEGEVDGLGDGDWGTPHTNGSLNADFLTPTTINNQDGGGGGGGGSHPRMCKRRNGN